MRRRDVAGLEPDNHLLHEENKSLLRLLKDCVGNAIRAMKDGVQNDKLSEHFVSLLDDVRTSQISYQLITISDSCCGIFQRNLVFDNVVA